jgi:hypothetical protein
MCLFQISDVAKNHLRLHEKLMSGERPESPADLRGNFGVRIEIPTVSGPRSQKVRVSLSEVKDTSHRAFKKLFLPEKVRRLAGQAQNLAVSGLKARKVAKGRKS